MRLFRIDRDKHLCDDPLCGHNRWHPDIPPRFEADAGEEIGLETRDAMDGYLTPASVIADFPRLPRAVVHPLTGPVLVKGAKPGDLLEVEFLDIVPMAWGFSSIIPGLGFLSDTISGPFLAHWDIDSGWATSKQIPGVRIPGAPFMGISGVAPSHVQLAAWTRREADLHAQGGLVFPPEAKDAVPGSGAPAAAGLRTIPPRENGGNFDVKQLTRGARLFLPVAVEGALFSTGDAHFSQGDGEVCLTAVEMSATVIVRFRVHAGEAARRNIRWPYFSRSSFFAEPRWAVPERFTATMGMPVSTDGVNRAGDLNLAARNALLQMISLLQERGFSAEQAYVICSVAVDLRVSNVVDVPNYVVTALLPEEIFFQP
jgi:formamidase